MNKNKVDNSNRLNISVIGLRGIPNIAGGAEIHGENLYIELAKKANITVYARKPYFPLDKRIKYWKNIKIKYVWCPKHKYFETIISSFLGVLCSIIDKPDIAHFHNIGSGLFIPLLKLCNIKTVITYHSKNFEHKKWGFFSKKFLQMCEFLSLKFADQIISISPIIAHRVALKFGRFSCVIPNGVHQIPRKRTSKTLNYFKCHKRKYILFVGRIEPEKCIHTLIYSFINLKAQDSDNFYSKWNLVIIGKVDYNSKYMRFIKKISSENTDILFPGYLSGDALSEFYSNAAVFVLPSQHEGHPIALLEAMSYKLPCIVSDIPETRLFNFDESRYFETENITLLEEQLKKVLSSKNIPRINYHLQKNNWKNISEKTYRVFTELDT